MSMPVLSERLLAVVVEVLTSGVTVKLSATILERFANKDGS